MTFPIRGQHHQSTLVMYIAQQLMPR